jgi:outer membrane protein
MKKTILFVFVALLLFTTAAMAESIAGKFGITARGGLSYVLNSEWTDQGLAEMNSQFSTVLNKDIKPGTGVGGGGGIMYGINDNLAFNFDVTYIQTDLKISDATREVTLGKGKIIDFSLGVQWRFMPESKFVPYIEVGFDYLLNKFDLDSEMGSDNIGVDHTFGGHLSGGCDFFITPKIALNAEIRGLYSTKGDLNVSGDSIAVAKYNPSNISGFLGIRYFFP